MAVHPLTYAYLSGRYTLTSISPVCCRRAWYQSRVHPSAPDPSGPRRRWLEKRFPKRPNARRSHLRLSAIPCRHWEQS